MFARGCTLEAAEAVCTGEESNVVDRIQSLLDKTLLQTEHGTAGEPRLVMLETVREYALERLRQSGEEAELQSRHATYYLMLGETAEQQLVGPDEVVWLTRLESERDNIRAALEWSLGQEQVVTAARLATALRWFWDAHGHLTEGRHYLDAILAAGAAVPTTLRTKALDGVGMAAYRQGEYARAMKLLTECVAVCRESEDHRTLAFALNDIGLLATLQGDLEQARMFLQESLTLAREREFIYCAAIVLCNLGVVSFLENRIDETIVLTREALMLAQQLESTRMIAIAHIMLGIGAVFLGNVERAQVLLQEGLSLNQQVDDRVWCVYGLIGLAGVCAAQARSHLAAQLLGAADMLSSTIGAPIPAAVQARFAPIVIATRSQLADAAFEIAWVKGQTMSVRDTIDETFRHGE